MKKTVLKILAPAAFLVFAALLSRYPAGQNGEAARRDGKILRMASKQADTRSLNPHRATASHDRVVAEMIFNGLLRYRPGSMAIADIEPDLARWMPRAETLPDGTQRWTFELRRGVKFHPFGDREGAEVTAQDVVYSLRRACDPGKSSYAGDYQGMRFEAAGRDTVRVILAQPVTADLLLPKLSNRGGGLVVCRQAIEQFGEDWFNINPVGTGPFRFTGYTPMEKVELAANREYFRGAPGLAGIEYYYMPYVISRELALRKGEVDVIWGPREQVWGDKMSGLPGITVDLTDGVEIMSLHFNMSLAPLDSRLVREAIAHAVDRGEFIALYGPGVARPVSSVVPHGMLRGGLSEQEAVRLGLVREFSPEKSRALLARAGWPDGFTLKVFVSESDTYVKAFDLLQAQLGRVGIALKISIVDQATYHARIRQDLNPLVFYTCYRPNPDIILTQFFHSASIVAAGSSPITNFCHLGAVDADGDGEVDSIDHLIEQARRETDPDRQAELWKQAQAVILDQVAAYPLMALGFTFARSTDVNWGYDLRMITDGPKATEATTKQQPL